MKNEILFTVAEARGFFVGGMITALMIAVLMYFFIPFLFQKLADSQND